MRCPQYDRRTVSVSPSVDRARTSAAHDGTSNIEGLLADVARVCVSAHEHEAEPSEHARACDAGARVVSRPARAPACRLQASVAELVLRTLAEDELQSSAPARHSRLLSPGIRAPPSSTDQTPAIEGSSLARTRTTLTRPRDTAPRVLPYACPAALTRSARGTPVVSDVTLRMTSGTTGASPAACSSTPQSRFTRESVAGSKPAAPISESPAETRLSRSPERPGSPPRRTASSVLSGGRIGATIQDGRGIRCVGASGRSTTGPRTPARVD
jgi:hypothetical protein